MARSPNRADDGYGFVDRSDRTDRAVSEGRAQAPPAGPAPHVDDEWEVAAIADGIAAETISPSVRLIVHRGCVL